jgi:cystathionine gamma-synthase
MTAMVWRPETIAVAAGRARAPGAPFNVPPTFASTYRDGGATGYGRFGNPTWGAFEEALGALEGGHAVAFASGMAAIEATLARLPAGATVVLPAGAYLGTRGLLKELEATGRLRLRPIDVTDTGAVLDSLPGASMLWLESPTNPMLGIAELPRILDAASRAGVATAVDNTFATPLNQQPLAWGAAAVVHSATKYLGGHSDLLMGAVVTADPGGRDSLVEHRTLHGAIPGVMEAYLALRGLRTLPVRLARQQDTAAQIAEWLAGQPRVTRVRYPGLAGDPHHERAPEARGGRFRRRQATAHVVIGVLAAAGGRGVGTGLLRELDRWAPAHGIRRLELTVMAHNQRASALYRRVGYTVEGRARECLFVDGRPADELYMAKLFPEPAPAPRG